MNDTKKRGGDSQSRGGGNSACVFRERRSRCFINQRVRAERQHTVRLLQLSLFFVSYRVMMLAMLMKLMPRAKLFKQFNLDQNNLDLEIPCFAIQDQVISITFVLVFQSNIGLD